MSDLKLPVYTNGALEVGRLYSTLVLDGSYFPINEEVKLVDESGVSCGVGTVESAKTTNFNNIGYNDLKGMANVHLQSWPNAAEYFSIKYGSLFDYAGDVQLITFLVTGAVAYDTPLIESVRDEKELGLPNEEELGVVDEEESPVSYTVEEDK